MGVGAMTPAQHARKVQGPMCGEDRKVVITGIGVVSPLGADLAKFWESIAAGKSGIRPIESFDASSLDARIAGEVVDFEVSDFVDKKNQRRMDAYCHYAIGASKLAAADANLDMNVEDPHRAGVIIGSGIGGLSTIEKQYQILVEKGPKRCSPFMIPQMISNMAAGNVAIELNMKGPNYAVVSACATGLHCIGDAMSIIRRGSADIMVAGGSEAAVCMLGIAGFCALRALSTRNDEPTRASRPFDADRDGFVMSEGSAVVVLEDYEHARKRGAEIYCEAAGFGMTCDAHHMTAPAEGGAGAALAMKQAMDEAHLVPTDIDYINAHGTSTQLNDKAETAAIKTAFGEDRAREIPVSSTKSMTGHLLGAAGGIETAICALAMKHGVVPPTINYETPDPACDLDYVPNESREKEVRACINNSLGFGGHNATLLMKQL
jgi:3-oxoacyl-[acyl-carrier-protein] synthase II